VLFVFFNLTLTIRYAISEDAALIRALIQELAEYDGEARHVRTTETSLVTAWRTGIAKAFERQYADQLHRRHK
jgi:hypothetical protein